MSDPILSARGLAKNFQSGDRRIEVLRGVDLEIATGDSISVRGESGSGKSTLLNLLSGLDAPDAGQMHWEGAASITPERRARFLGMVFQSFYLIPELDARQNVLMAARIAGRVGEAENKRADELLARVGLAERAHHVPAHLSGGERQRVAIARALMNRPRLLLADEPTGNLDEDTAEGVIELLLSLCADTGTALVLVTHSPVFAARTTREVRLHLGKLQNVRPTDESSAGLAAASPVPAVRLHRQQLPGFVPGVSFLAGAALAKGIGAWIAGAVVDSNRRESFVAAHDAANSAVTIRVGFDVVTVVLAAVGVLWLVSAFRRRARLRQSET